MLQSDNSNLFKLNTTIQSEHKVYAEWNMNDFMAIEDYGCYTDTYSLSYSVGSGYDTGKSNIFFDGEGRLFTISGSKLAGVNQFDLGNNHGVTQYMRVQSNILPADTYVVSVVGNTVTLSTGITAAISTGSSEDFYFYDYIIQDNKDRLKYTPLLSIFESNRPDPGIIHLIGNNRNPNPIIDIEKLTISNFGDITGETRDDRVYPIYKNASYRYWNSIRKIQKNGLPKTVGTSNGSLAITHAAPFAVYEDSFYTNKIVIKTQKYAGYPVSFSVDVLLDGSSNWTSVYSVSNNSTVLADGILEIYYNGTSWTTTESFVTEFIGTPSNTQHIYGIRFSVTKMSNSFIPLEVIELSPRLSADITEYVMSFDKTSSLNNTSYGIPVAGVVSTTGGIKISNVDRIFSSRNPNSILSNMLYQGTKFIFRQVVDGEQIPLGTLYAIAWNEANDFSTNIELEDFFFFLKSMKAPDIVIANLSGIETSVALLMLFDNVGVTNYNFRRRSSESVKDDFVMDFFYSDRASTVTQVLEQIANSAQYAIYVDANNIIQAVTKESFSNLVDANNTNFWLVGSETWTESDDETPFLDGEYVSNIMSLSEESVQPITEATVGYTGNGIVRDAKGILKAQITKQTEDTTNLTYNASLATRDLSYGISQLWSIESDQGSSSQSLIALTYISDILGPSSFTGSNGIPAILDNAKDIPVLGVDENAVIRYMYQNATESERKYFTILIDREFGTQFIQSGKFSGYVLIDSEIIKYHGLIVDIFDDKSPENSGKGIVFNQSEYSELKANLSSGSSIVCRGLVVDLNFEVQDIENALSSGDKEYLYVSSGRGYKGTAVVAHNGETETDFITNKFVTKLYDTTYPKSLKPSGTMVAKSIKINDPRLSKAGEDTRVAYPGYLKYSGPKGVFDKNQQAKVGTNNSKPIPIDNFGERFLSGFYKNISFSPHRISTRMRLLEKPKKYQDLSGGENARFNNRGIAGIGFRLKPGTNGMEGYFVEIEEVGNIQETQIESKEFNNLRLYKVKKNSSGKFIPTLLGSAFVNVSAVANESVDIGQAEANNGFSYTGTSDLSVTIEESGQNFVYNVFWEAQKVLSIKEPAADAINKKSAVIGLFGRSDSEAMFEYIMAASVNKNGNFPVSTIFGKGSNFMKLQEAAERGLLPGGLSEAVVGKDKTRIFYDDFGNQLREIGKFSVKFDTPAVYAQLVSLAEINKDYYVADFSASSYGADFWVFNTSRASINLGGETKMPLIISGVAINKINSGEVTLTEYISKRLGDDSDRKSLIEKNRAKYGTNNVSVSGEYLNSLSQADNLLQWIVENASKEKKVLNAEIFPNPLFEIGDKVRVFYPEMQYNISNQKDKVYYVHAIGYSVDGNGPKMNISVREI